LCRPVVRFSCAHTRCWINEQRDVACRVLVCVLGFCADPGRRRGLATTIGNATQTTHAYTHTRARARV
jgi:hypothetical protein